MAAAIPPCRIHLFGELSVRMGDRVIDRFRTRSVASLLAFLAFHRHQSLRAALDWSYHLLSPEVQRFFCHLSVFRGGWTAEAAEYVGEEPRVSEYLEHLRESSIVLATDGGPEMRFSMLETVREFAGDRLLPNDRDTALPYNATKAARAWMKPEREGDALAFRGDFAGVWNEKGENTVPNGAQLVKIDAWTGRLKEAR